MTPDTPTGDTFKYLCYACGGIFIILIGPAGWDTISHHRATCPGPTKDTP